MDAPRFTLVTDGPTDGDMLRPILRWLLGQQCPGFSDDVNYADVLKARPVPRGLARRIAFAVRGYPCDCLFVHRDAENAAIADRHGEIERAVESLPAVERPAHHVRVIPVRMSEAWLLIDESAIRRAAGNPNGRVDLNIPRLAKLEDLPDPKQLLYELLVLASELAGRRRKTFDAKGCSRRVAALIDDFSPLRQLPAFQSLEADVRRLAEASGWEKTGLRRSDWR